MHFHVMESPLAECYPGGEFEIEMASSHELEIRHKDLLPIFDNFPRARSGWNDRLSIPYTWLLFLVILVLSIIEILSNSTATSSSTTNPDLSDIL